MSDFTIRTEATSAGTPTATEGDFRYGLVLRRSGSNYYVFAVSPRLKTWYVLKNSPSGVEQLDEGQADSIAGLAKVDVLQVEARATKFTFKINDGVVSEIDDADFTSGEAGFYIETIDSPRAHIHFDSVEILE